MKPGRKPPGKRPAVPLQPGERRLIVATCEKGAVEAVDDMRQVQKQLDAIKKANPNLVEVAARQAFEPVEVDAVADAAPRSWALTPARRRRAERIERRSELRIGIPRILNMYSHAPFFLGYFQSLGIPAKHIVFSSYTSEEQYRRGAKRGAIDPCFPTKVGIPHVHELLELHRKKPLTHIFIPMVDSFPTYLDGVLGSRACPALVASVEATYAAFIKEGNAFEKNGIRFRKTFLNLDEPLLCARQMHEDWEPDLGTTLAESHRAVEQGLRALSDFEAGLQRRGREVLDELEREDRIGIVVLSRPYHNDPGLNHGVCEALQKLGYPILTQDTLPRDPDVLERIFGWEVEAGLVRSPLSIDDVWKQAFSEQTSRKLWAAKFVARHANLVALELSSFKCGHDAPIYSTIEEIVECSGTPYFCFKDIDENRPAGAIKIRIETIAYFLRRYRDELVRRRSEARASAPVGVAPPPPQPDSVRS